ncbi:hypothetical protein QJS10_CPB15g01257 [Acorus calamus]|uniref:Uncharacterized protein n=1 Tax=Acorus calamus TaxID=4465 RepID=A0AAV9D3E2_ACOCL|nr:hypothetical protein QJS10_CPB15g01257 [Acorus calamus]
MASAAFKSTTKRSQITGPAKTSSDDASSSSRSRMLRRSRSLSRNPGRRNPEADDFRTPKGKFVNTERGSGFPDVNLDDLADEFFMAVERDSEEERARSIGRLSRSTAASESAQRRGRSVSRGGQTAEGSGILVDNRGRRGDVENRLSRRRSLSVARYQSGHSEVRALEGKGSSENGFGRKGVSDGDSRRRRSASVARHRRGDLEARDVEMTSVSESNARRRRSLSVARYRGSDSESYSSALTEDEGWSSHANKYGIEKTIRAVYAQNKIDHPIGDEEETGFYEAMRKEVRHAVEEMRTELEQVMGKGQSNAPTSGFKSRTPDISQDISEMRKNYTTKLEQSEKRKQDLLAELAVEEQRARELSQVVKDLLPEPKSTAPVSRPSRNRRVNPLFFHI